MRTTLAGRPRRSRSMCRRFASHTVTTALAAPATSANTSWSTTCRYRSLAWAVTEKVSPVRRWAMYAVCAATVMKWACRCSTPCAEAASAKQSAWMRIEALCLADAASAQGVEHLHAHFMTVAAHTAYIAHLLTGLTFSVTAHAKDLYRQVVDQDVFAEVAGAASAVVTVCDANRRHIERLLRGRPPRVVRIYNGVPIDRMAPDGSARDRRLVLGVGRQIGRAHV